jgi:hypothetical protein
MARLLTAFVLIIWMIITLILVCSLFGLTLLLGDGSPSSWMRLGRDLAERVTK